MKRVSSQESDPEVWTIKQGDRNVFGIGDRAIMGRKCLGLICSVQCPGSVVIKTFDAIRELRDAGVVVAGASTHRWKRNAWSSCCGENNL